MQEKYRGDVDERLRKLALVGRSTFHWIWPLLCKQATCGSLCFDFKPSNCIVAGEENRCYAIDLDAAMYVTKSGASFATCLFLSLLLLTAHIRVNFAKALVEGFVHAARAPLLRLCRPAQCSRFIVCAEARAEKQWRRLSWTSLDAGDEDALCRAYELVAHTYFFCNGTTANLNGNRMQPYENPLNLSPPPLLTEQLLRFALLGRADAVDIDVDAAFNRSRSLRHAEDEARS